MLIVFGVFLLLFRGARACTCDGIEIAQSDQKHCYQIIRNTGNSWVTADEKCSSMGGFLAHFNSTTLYNQLNDYILQNYRLPLITGATVANVELDLVALMCPSNVFYSLLSSSFVSSFFEGSPTTADRCTFIVNDATKKLQYLPCDTNADILCDRPMENTNYCNIKMNCTETTTTKLLTTSMKATTASSTLSSTTEKSSTTQSPSTSTTTSATSTKSATATTPTTQSSTTTIPSTRSSTPSTKSSTSSKKSSTPSTATTPTPTPTATTPSTKISAATSTTTPTKVSSSSSSVNPNSTSTKTSMTSSPTQSNLATTQTSSENPNTTLTLSTTVASTTKIQSTTSQITNTSTTPPSTQPVQNATYSTTTLPSLITSTNPSSSKTSASTPFYAKTSPPPAITSSPDSCGSGYTDIFGWCVPWWCWLIFGLLLLGLLLCCIGWLLHFCCAVCLCSHKKNEKNIERQWNGEDAICQTDPFVIPLKDKSVYIPVPKTPPLPHVVKEREPINTHTILHTHEIIHEKSAPPPPSVVYDVTIYENAFNKNTILVPPIVHETQPSPNIFLPPQNFERQALPPPEDDIISANSIPFFSDDLKTPSPIPLYTKDESDPVPILPVFAAPSVVPVLPLKPPKKKKERRPVSPLKYNRPPIGSQFDEEPKPKKSSFLDDARDFPKPPPRDVETPTERAFPQPPPPRTPEIRKRSSISKELPDEYSDRPVRKNTPLNLNTQPERLSLSPKPNERAPAMPRLPQRSPFEVPSPTNDVKPRKKRAASPPITIFEPPNSLSQAPKLSNQRRLSPMHDEPPRLPSSPRKFSTPPPQKTFAADDISSKSIATPPSASQRPRRRRQSLDGSDPTTTQNDVSMRAPRGRLGANNDKPDGWKPWAKSPKLFSGHPGFLDD